MLKKRSTIRITKRILIVSTLWLGLFGSGQANAGGILLYEAGTPDVGLASAGWGARAQDASTILTNPAGMTRLEGSQVLVGAQALYADYGFSIGSGTSSGLGEGDGGNPIGWVPSRAAAHSSVTAPRPALNSASAWRGTSVSPRNMMTTGSGVITVRRRRFWA